jgi:hypothetical protein
MSRFVVVNARGELVREWDIEKQEWAFLPAYVEASDQRFAKECGIAVPPQAIVQDGPKVVWRFYEAGYERSYHGAPCVIELGEIE